MKAKSIAMSYEVTVRTSVAYAHFGGVVYRA